VSGAGLVAVLDDRAGTDPVGDVVATVGGDPVPVGQVPLAWDASLDLIAPALADPLADAAGHDWWAPLRIDLAMTTQAWLAARTVRDRLAERGVAEVRLTSRLPALWTSALSPLPVRLDRVGSAWSLAAGARGPLGGDLLKKRGRDRTVRRLLTSARGGPRRAADWLVVGEVPTPSMLDGLTALPPERVHVLACDPRVHRLAAERGHATSSLWPRHPLGPAREAAGLLRRARHLLGRLGDLSGALDPVVHRLLPGLVRDLPLLRSALVEVGARVVVLASDQHRYGVLSTWAASAVGTPSVVLQHGFPVHPVAYAPVRASAVACIGTTSAEWFVAAGTPRERLVVCGSPRMSAALPLRPPAGARRLLVALNASEERLLAALVGDLAAVARADPGLQVVLRPHPGDHRFRDRPGPEVLAALGAGEVPASVAVDGSAPLAGQLDAADLVVVHDSTVAIDALLAGRPVVVYAPDADRHPFRGARLPVVRSRAELAALLGGLTGPDRDATAAELAGRCTAARDRIVRAGGADAVRLVVDLLDRLGGTGPDLPALDEPRSRVPGPR